MVPRSRFVSLALCAALTTLSCSKGGHPSLVSSAAPVTNSTLEQLTVASRDCLQYPVEHRADGTEIWNADYFYFTLFDRKTDKPYLGSDGKPLAQALLASQAITFMDKNP